MLRRLFLIPALAIAGIFTLASSAKADTVNFSGIVPDSCTWGLATDGVLQYDPAFPNTLTSNGALPASIEITCPSGGTVTVADPVPGTNPVPTNNRAWVIGVNGTIDSPAGGGGTLTINGSPIAEVLDVHMEAISVPPTLAAGTYSYTVTLTAAP
jgi:hypothetical protein